MTKDIYGAIRPPYDRLSRRELKILALRDGLLNGHRYPADRIAARFGTTEAEVLRWLEEIDRKLRA